jgi:hypothetical protein
MKRKFRNFELSVILAGLFSSAQAQQPSAIQLSGFVNTRYAWSNEDDVTHGFDIRRVRVSAAGQLTDALEYAVQTEYETSLKLIAAYINE